MPVLVLRCPHCTAEDMSFSFVGEHRVAVRDVSISESSSYGGEGVWNTLFVCRRCQQGVVVRVQAHPGHTRAPSKFDTNLVSAFAVLEVHPKLEKINPPDHVPRPIAQNYREAIDGVRRQNYTSAAFVFRKILDRATRDLAPEGAVEEFGKMPLFQRINALADHRQLTPAMRDWAHQIRLEGNEAVHDEDADAGTAAQLQAFTEMFLIYAFTLPERVRQSRSKAAVEGEG